MKSEPKISTLAARLYRLVGGFVIVMVITGVLSFGTLSRLKVNGPIYTKITQQKDLLADILPPPMYVLETYETALQALGESDPAALKADLKKIQSLQQDYSDRTAFWTKELTDSPARRALLDDSHKPAAEFFATLTQEFIPAIEKQDKASAAAIAYGKLRSAYLDHRQAIDQVVSLATQDSQALEAQAAGEVRHRTIIMAAVLTGSLVLIGMFSLMTTRSLIRNVKSAAFQLAEGSAQVASAAGQVSACSQSLAEGASEQAASLEETSASIEELSSITKRNAENAQKANDLARQARTAADAGSGDMQAMNQAMEAVKVSSDDIAKIIKTIDEIAFQTNILALNAAVEAARAGEAGMGFAVVADEVRNLAQRCAQSARETSSKIEGAIARTTQGVALSARVTERLQDILSKVRQVDELAAEVATASQEQSTGISQVSVAVTQMDKVTQANAASAEETASAAEEMNSQAELFKQAVNDLMCLAGGSRRNDESTSASSRSAFPMENSAAVSERVGNGHVKAVAAIRPAFLKTRSREQPLSAASGNDIPMDSDFKDF